MDLQDSIIQLKGIGKNKEKSFHKLQIFNVGNLLDHYPVRYEDRAIVSTIKGVAHGTKILIKARIIGTPVVKRIRSNLSIIHVLAQDDTFIPFELVWYNVPYIKNQLKSDVVYYFYGGVNCGQARLRLESPEFVIEKNIHDIIGILPKYALTKGITQKDVRKAVKHVLSKEIKVYDYLREEILEEHHLITLKEAMENIHFPASYEKLDKAKERLIINEFIEIILGFRYLKEWGKTESIPLLYTQEIENKINLMIEHLPFILTQSQQQVIQELIEDVKNNQRINRLIQGDVGSGKTIVALIMIYLCFLNGYQSVMMVPTGILAEQHYNTVTQLFQELGIEMDILLMTRFNSKKRRLDTLQKIARGEVQLIIATHGVLQEDVAFDNLGLVITDEQHRFGVRQRKQLNNKGKSAHSLVMSATPIPRTITLSLYGDLDVSVIDALPEGRKEIKTYCVNTNYRQRIYNFIIKHIKEGRQAYIICPAIEQNVHLESVESMYENLKYTSLKNVPMGLIHGKMSMEEKEEIMHLFHLNKISILVATTVIEVGIDVPNATVMVIENADRFGLAQLHQIRGRVGRSNIQSYCILITEQNQEKTLERLHVLVESNDGFYISERDLDLRGPGDYFGFNQHGLPTFKLANLIEHHTLFMKAQKIVEELLMHFNDDEALLNNIIEIFNNKLNEISMN
ncbi:MAG: ATP-dependent DNA helicase RecG [Eubacteriales bacterium]